MGDQDSDLAGDYAVRTFELPIRSAICPESKARDT
jgi:hypothetical protein